MDDDGQPSKLEVLQASPVFVTETSVVIGGIAGGEEGDKLEGSHGEVGEFSPWLQRAVKLEQ